MNLRLLKNFLVVFIIIFNMFLVLGCKPGGGGGVGNPIIPVTGGDYPHMQELIIDEESIRVDKIQDTSCRIYWRTNVPATSCVEYGQSLNFDKTTPEDKNLVLEHYVELYSLIPKTRYYFKVISSDAFKHLAQSKKEIYFETFDKNFPPQAVTLYNPTNITSNSMKLSWSQSYDIDFLRYELYRDTTSQVSFMSPKIATITSKMQTEYIDTNLNPNTLYYYILYVIDTAELSTPSNIVSGTTSVQYNPLTKINFNEPIKRTTDSLTLSWNKCTENDFASYRIYKSNKPNVDTLSELVAEITDRDSISIEIKNLSENTPYYFKLYLKNKGNVFTASDEAMFKTYKNGELIKSISGIYYGNDIKIYKNKAFITSYDYIYIVNLNTFEIKTLNLNGVNNRMRFASTDITSNGKIYIVNQTFKEIIILDPETETIIKRLPGGNSPIDVAIDINNNFYYTIDFFEGRVRKFNLNTGTQLASKYVGYNLSSIVQGINNNNIFVTRYSETTGEIYMLSSDLVILNGPIEISEQPNFLYVDKGGNKVYCSNFKNKQTTIINAMTGNFDSFFETGLGSTSITQTQNGKYLFVSNFNSSNITMYNSITQKVVETISDGKMPKALDLSDDGRILYVIDYDTPTLNLYAIRQ